MSTENDKFKKSKRLLNDGNAIKKQLKIAKSSGNTKYVEEPHRLSKQHAMDCGNPGCALCGNPRHTHKDTLTPQEKRLFQDVEKITDRRSNGLKNDNPDRL